MHRRARILILGFSLLAGCYSPRLYPVAPVVVRLAAPSGFTVARTASADAPASSCVVERAEFEVTALRGDTLYFAKAAVLLQNIEADPCAQQGAGFVVLANHPELRSERLALNHLLTGAGALSILPAMGVLFLLALFSVG